MAPLVPWGQRTISVSWPAYPGDKPTARRREGGALPTLGRAAEVEALAWALVEALVEAGSTVRTASEGAPPPLVPPPLQLPAARSCILRASASHLVMLVLPLRAPRPWDARQVGGAYGAFAAAADFGRARGPVLVGARATLAVANGECGVANWAALRDGRIV